MFAYTSGLKCPQRKQWGEKRSGDLTGQAVAPKVEVTLTGNMTLTQYKESRVMPAVPPSRRRQHQRLTSPALCNIVLIIHGVRKRLYPFFYFFYVEYTYGFV